MKQETRHEPGLLVTALHYAVERPFLRLRVWIEEKTAEKAAALSAAQR